ncbi:MAG: YihA family ribosome biogenesis GTP-binding protein [Verrucomicrobia bacterium]|nr:YihA family ribosome biogenesis GTP-binding protein [Verrucomicrobiota bacterium]
MKIKSAVFERSVPDLKSCPKSLLPEFAFIGRSNVGKSSMINLLSERSALAKVSVTPGKTQLINFFLMNGSWHLVDLPGYGYAKVGQEQRADFNRAVANYLEKRTNLALVFVLIDSRLEPQRIDLEFIRWLAGCDVPFALVFTKTDKHGAAGVKANILHFEQTIAEWCDEAPPVFVTSSKTKSGRTELLSFIEKRLAMKPVVTPED